MRDLEYWINHVELEREYIEGSDPNWEEMPTMAELEKECDF